MNRISAIVNGKRSITAGTALRLSRYFGTSAEYWMNLQVAYDLRLRSARRGSKLTARFTAKTCRVKLGFVQRCRARSGGSFEYENMRRSNVALRLQASLLEEAKRVADPKASL